MIPLIVIDIHDVFYHHYNTPDKDASLAFKKHDDYLCLIHNFKYFSFEYNEATPSLYSPTIWEGELNIAELFFIKQNQIFFYLLRAPPYSIGYIIENLEI